MITIVYGPPCGGKTTYVAQHAKPEDLIIDWDTIAVRLGSPRQHLHPKPLLPAIRAAYDQQLALAPDWPADVWIIRGLPDHDERAAWARRFTAQLVECTAPIDELYRRATQRTNPHLTRWSIDRWLQRTRAGSTAIRL